MKQRMLQHSCLVLLTPLSPSQRILQAAYAMGFSVLATIRNSTVVPDGQRWCSIPVLPMGEDDSLVILKKYSRASDDVPREWALQVCPTELMHFSLGGFVDN